MLSTKLIKIDSDLREYGTNESFTYNLRSDVKFTKPELVYASIPNTYYNIIGAQLAVDDGQLTVITMADGQYNIAELCAAVQHSLRSGGDLSYTCTFDKITMRVRILGNLVFALNFLSYNQPELANRLGFTLGDYVGSNEYVGDVVPELVEQEYYVTISEIGLLGDGSDYTQRFTFVIPHDGIRGEYTRYSQQNIFKQCSFTSDITIHSFQVELRNRRGLMYDLNGGNWSLILATGHI